MAHTPLYAWLVGHGKTTFALMTVSFVAFGALSVNLVSHALANSDYLLSYGWYALKDGGLQQLIEIWLKALVAIGAYVIFKLCEHALIERLAHPFGDRPRHGAPRLDQISR